MVGGRVPGSGRGHVGKDDICGASQHLQKTFKNFIVKEIALQEFGAGDGAELRAGDS